MRSVSYTHLDVYKRQAADRANPHFRSTTMTGSPPELRSFLEAEMFYGVKKRERIAYAVAGGGLAIGLMGMIAVVTLLPLSLIHI